MPPQGRPSYDQFPYTNSDSRRDRLLIACGPATLLLAFLFFALLDLIPPIHPLQSPQETASHYKQNSYRMGIGIYLLLIASCLWPLHGVGISHQLSRIPGVSITILVLQISSACLLGFAYAVFATFFSAAVYRSDRDPAIT